MTYRRPMILAASTTPGPQQQRASTGIPGPDALFGGGDAATGGRLMQLRVLIHAPRGRDAAVVESVLSPHHKVHVCAEGEGLVQCMWTRAAGPRW